MSIIIGNKKTAKKPVKTPTKTPVKKEVEEKVEEEQVPGSNIIMLPGLGTETPSRSIGLIGDVNEERAGDVIYALLSMWKSWEPPAENPKERPDPIELYVSTHGGSASDMFAIYDVMRMVKKDSDIATIGLGKVMMIIAWRVLC
jgi:ATP-dependent protease ClpP protease subunit